MAYRSVSYLFALVSCVTRAAALSAARRSENSRPHASRSVWISSFPRSGSSTILSMLRAAEALVDGQEKSGNRSRVFSLFEPCHNLGGDHNNDIVAPELVAKRCPEMISRLAKCDFSDIYYLWGWSNKHTSNLGKEYSPDLASHLCRSAETIVFKTVGQGRTVDRTRELSQMVHVLEGRPEMRIINVVRDPRAIFASWKTVDPFPRILGERRYSLWKEVCETFAKNVEVEHAQVYNLVFERLVQAPALEMQRLYGFLGLAFGKAQKEWLADTFRDSPSDGCSDGNGYQDCHQNPRLVIEKWRQDLSAEELAAVNSHMPCRRVFKAYGYPAA